MILYHGENSNPNLTPNVADLLTKVNPLPSPDWPRRAEMIAERTRPREPRKEPRNRPKSRAFCLVMLFRAVPLVVQVPFGASGDDAHTNARALTHGTRLTEHSVRLSLVGEPHARVSRASPAHANARDRPPSSGRFSQSTDRENADRTAFGMVSPLVTVTGATVATAVALRGTHRRTKSGGRGRGASPRSDKAPAAIPRDADAVTRRGLTRTKASEREEGDVADGDRRAFFAAATGLFSPHGTCTTRGGPKPARSPSL